MCDLTTRSRNEHRREAQQSKARREQATEKQTARAAKAVAVANVQEDQRSDGAKLIRSAQGHEAGTARDNVLR